MNKYGIKDYKYIKMDFLNYLSTKKYDVVSSFGFIEHFCDTADILLRHLDILRDGGYLVITVPNFKGMQYFYHRLFDWENLRLHNTDNAMSKRFFKSFFEKRGHKIIFLDYYRYSDFWVEKPSKLYYYPITLIGLLLKMFLRIIYRIKSKWTSSFIICIVQK